MFADSEGAGGSRSKDWLVEDSQPLQGDEQAARHPADLLPVETQSSSGETLSDPTPLPLSESDLSRARRRRRWIQGLTPAGVLLPLVLVGFFIYLLTTDWLTQASPVTPTARVELTQPVTLTPLPPVPTAEERSLSPSPVPQSSSQPDTLLAQAEALLLRSEFEEAIKIYQDLLTDVPADPRPEIGWTQALLLDGVPDQALTHAQRAVALDPANVEALVVLARAYIAVGDKTRGLNIAERAVELGPDRAGAHAVLAEAYRLSGLLDLAAEEADLALARDLGNAEAHRVRASLYDTADNDLERAIAELRLAVNLQPELWLRHYDLGLLLLQANDYDAAIVALTDAWVLRRKPLTFNALGQAYYQTGQYDRAASFLEQSLSAGANDASTYAFLAAINAQRGRCQDAAIYSGRALAVDPNNPLALETRNTCQGGEEVAIASSTAEPSGTGSIESPTQSPSSPPPTPPALRGRIAFPVWNEGTRQYDTYVAKVDGSERQLVAEEMHQPAYSPDGQWLAVNGERSEHMNLFIVHPDGSGLRKISEHVEDGLPYWSPDGQSLAFSSTRHSDRQSRIYILDQVPFDGVGSQARALNFGPDDVRGEHPAWLSDGRIVYTGCHYEGVSAQCGLLAMPTEPGPQTPQPLTIHPEDTAPAAFGGTIAFMSNRDGNWELYVVGSDGSGLKRLTHNTFNDGLPTWSADGRTIAFVSDQGGAWAVWAINPDGSGRRKLFDIGGGGLVAGWQQERISWGP